MSVESTHTLKLACDEPNCHAMQTIVDDTRAQVLETARMNGWLITRSNQCRCPEHAEAYRQRGYR